MSQCACGCGRDVEQHDGRGRRAVYANAACRKRDERKRKSDVTKLNGDVTEILNQITTGDSRELAKRIPDGSIDLIFTDPPYPKEYLALYGWLAQEAQRVLKPGGFLLTYAGNMYLHEVMMSLGHHLTYFWHYIALDSGPGTVVWNKRTVARHKSILAYSSGSGKPRCNTLGVWNGSGKDKKYHSWGQDEQTARYYIDCFTSPYQLVWEPFAGGGTTCVVCRQIERNFIGFELDEKAATKARKRLDTIQMPLPELRASQLSLVEEVS